MHVEIDPNASSSISQPENAEPKKVIGKPFPKGWKGGPGRTPKPKADNATARAIMMACTDEEWEAIHKVLIREAKKGSAAHIKLLAEYNFAKPDENVIVTANTTAKVEQTTTHVHKGIASDASEQTQAERDAVMDLVALRAVAQQQAN